MSSWLDVYLNKQRDNFAFSQQLLVWNPKRGAKSTEHASYVSGEIGACNNTSKVTSSPDRNDDCARPESCDQIPALGAVVRAVGRTWYQYSRSEPATGKRVCYSQRLL
jgi:hypothetical protein